MMLNFTEDKIEILVSLYIFTLPSIDFEIKLAT